MEDKTLNAWLDSHQTPPPSSDLSARILAATTPEGSTVINNHSIVKWIMPIAATILAICAVGFKGFAVFNNESAETALWQEAALDLGFDEIYDWVENEEYSAQ